MSYQSVFEDKILQIYGQLYQYKDLLQEGPALTLTPSSIGPHNKGQVATETKRVIGYLLGIQMSGLTVGAMTKSLGKHYQTDDFWRRLLLTYIEAQHEWDIAQLEEDTKQVHAYGAQLYKNVMDYRSTQKQIITEFAAAIAKENFPVNAKKLVTNYMNMSLHDPEQAWKTLIENPAYFSPIITIDANGKKVLTPKEAMAQNIRLGDFIKRLKL